MSQSSTTQAVLIGTLVGALVVAIGVATFLYFQNRTLTSQAPSSVSKEAKNPVVTPQPEPSVTPPTTAQSPLPFIGERFINFMGGTGTQSSITIEKDGTTLVKGLGAMFEGKPGLESV